MEKLFGKDPSIFVQIFAVGMLVTQHPPHRSVRAILVHTALPTDNDTKSFIRMFMTYLRAW